MIPRIIHYCWFGHNSLPEASRKCMHTWQKKCPNYEIREWNEDTFDLTQCPRYVQQAYEAGKWAFVSDYVRLYVVYKFGGIYLDTDIELRKSLDELLRYRAFFGFEEGKYINTGLGFGAEAGCEILVELMQDYQEIPFIRSDGTQDTTPCPKRNTAVFLRHGLRQDDTRQILAGNILILPTIYLCPIEYRTNKMRHSLRTISIHHYSASWHTEGQKAQRLELQQEVERRKRQARKERIVKIPKKILRGLCGEKGYETVKKWLRP